MSKWTNVRKFDFNIGEYTNSYYKLSDFDYFVDSEFGSDTNDGLTPQTAFKTISKLNALGTTLKNKICAVSGIFIENITFANWNDGSILTIIGVSGFNGRAIINGAIFYSVMFANIYSNQLKTCGSYSNSSILTSIGVNCILELWYTNIGLYGSRWGGCKLLYDCFIKNASKQDYPTSNLNAFDSVAVFKNVTIEGFGTEANLQSGKFENCHIISISSYSSSLDKTNTLLDTNSRYFTDNTETTPADLYIDSANGNYGIVENFTTPIWDKTTQQYITKNPLYNNGNIIGCGKVTLALTAQDTSLQSQADGGNATYDNMQNGTPTTISRIDDSIDGTILSGVQDLGRVMNGVKIDAISTYDVSGSVITKRLQQSIPTIEQATDFYIQFGETIEECNAMTPILCEFGKVITYSTNGSYMYGNSDGTNFQPSKKKVAKFRYFKINIKARTISA